MTTKHSTRRFLDKPLILLAKLLRPWTGRIGVNSRFNNRPYRQIQNYFDSQVKCLRLDERNGNERSEGLKVIFKIHCIFSFNSRKNITFIFILSKCM